MELISVIVTTYNWPEALDACLQGLLNQTDRNFEILIADDGSNASTLDLITSRYLDTTPQIKHIYHEDLGFRAGAIRNKATVSSKGDYLIFMDGDCVALPNFIYRHRQLANKGYFVPGNRVLLSENFTATVLKEQIPLYDKPTSYFFQQWFNRKINRIAPLFYLPLGPLRHLHLRRWQKAMTCNLGIWKQDFVAVNGFDEVFEGWGYEDSDLVIRLIHRGIKRKEGRFAIPVLHLWHRHNDRSQHDINYQRLMERLNQKDFIRAQKGLDQYY